eukprot:356814-Chlamydomonas_euryale.AAC.1
MELCRIAHHWVRRWSCAAPLTTGLGGGAVPHRSPRPAPTAAQLPSKCSPLLLNAHCPAAVVCRSLCPGGEGGRSLPPLHPHPINEPTNHLTACCLYPPGLQPNYIPTQTNRPKRIQPPKTQPTAQNTTNCTLTC